MVAAAAGARRTDSAVDRHLLAYDFPDATVFVATDPHLGDDVTPAVAALPRVKASSIGAELVYVARGAKGRQVLSVGPRAMAVRVSLDGRDGVTLSRWKLLAGRRPDSRRPNEALVDSRAAETLGVEPGDEVHLRVFEPFEVVNFRGDPETMHAGRLVRVRVVGVKAATDTGDFPGGVVRLTPAFYRDNVNAKYDDKWVSVRLERGAADIPAFRAAVERNTGLPGEDVVDQRQTAAATEHSIHLQVQALWLAAALGGLLAFVLVAQALFRLAGFAAVQHPTLRALGMTERQLVAVGVARAIAIAVVAAALACAAAAALSPLTPIGLARELEPDPGFALDAVAVALGGAAVLVSIALAGALVSWRAARSPAGVALPPSAPAGSVVAEALARRGVPATIVTGVRLALGRGSGASAVPIGATLLGGVLAVAVACTALTFSASLERLFSTPRLYGQNWDYRSNWTSNYVWAWEVPRLLARVRADPSITDAAIGNDLSNVLVNGRPVAVRAMDDIKGALPPVVLDGRAPVRANEILLAPKTLDALGLEIGDTVDVRRGLAARMRVVGRGIVAAGRSTDLGKGGAAMTYRALRRIDASPGVILEAKFATRANREATIARLERGFGISPARGIPRTVGDFGDVDEMPLVVLGLLVAIAAGALAHTLVLAVRRRKRDLAILKTLGFDRREVLATVFWQATTFAAIALLVGIPLGVGAGRWAWNRFAEEIGVVPEVVTPVSLLVLIVPGAVLLANLVAAVPARVAARTSPAAVLRAE